MPMTRAEHLAWCKKRALEYVQIGQLEQAVTSITSDLRKHDETADYPAAFGLLGLKLALKGDAQHVRAWIEGFR